MNLIALLLELLFGHRLRLQPATVRSTRADAESSFAPGERLLCRSDAWLAGMGSLTGSNPTSDSNACDRPPRRLFDPFRGRSRRSWSG